MRVYLSHSSPSSAKLTDMMSTAQNPKPLIPINTSRKSVLNHCWHSKRLWYVIYVFMLSWKADIYVYLFPKGATGSKLVVAARKTVIFILYILYLLHRSRQRFPFSPLTHFIYVFQCISVNYSIVKNILGHNFQI